MFVVFDLDGTLALNEHRQHFINRPVGEKDWDAFHAACDKDEPFWQIVRICQTLLATGNRVEIWTGRSVEVTEKTITWLTRHGIGNVCIRMRPRRDHTPDTDLKLQWLNESSQCPDLVFEDRASVVQMWRANGINCVQVADGNF